MWCWRSGVATSVRLVVSSWRSEKDLGAYVESDIAHSVITRLSPLMVESPIASNFEMTLVVEGEEGVFTRDEGGEG